MAYLNQQEREKLLNELTKMSVPRARGKLRRMDSKGKLAFIRNAQATGEFFTRYDLHGLGVVVTLVERKDSAETATDEPGAANVRYKPDFYLSEVSVEPMPDNHS